MTTTAPDPTLTVTTTDPADIEAAVGELAMRVAVAAIGSFELATVELGMRLGLYAALADAPATPGELAARAGIDTRYAREWLEQQTTSGFVEIVASPANGDPDQRVFSLPAVTAICLLDPDSLACVAPLATFASAGPTILPELERVYRTGEGLSFADYGDWIRRAQSAGNRPQFTNLLVQEWLPTMPDVVSRLRKPGARVADIGCGTGWSAIALARGFDQLSVDGFDNDAASIEDARTNVAEAGVTAQVHLHLHDAAAEIDGTYDLVTCFEALHDMAHPVEALSTMRALAGTDGTVLIVDERAADALTPNDPDPMQRLFYAASVLHCLVVGRSEEHSAATGTVMRVATLERYAQEAGFSSVEVLPIEHDMFRFYRLHV